MSTPLRSPAVTPSAAAAQLRHVRWLVGGTGSGKSTIAAVLARQCDVDVYAGDRAESDWIRRCSPERQPHLAALGRRRPGDTWRDRSPREVFEAMAGRHGETVGFLVADLAVRPRDRIVIVDYFGVLPEHVAPLLTWPGQAVFLLPTPAFRRATLTRRYADPDRARANWGDLDPATVLEQRLERDALWDAEVAAQVRALDLRRYTVDGTRSPDDLAAGVAEEFRL